jgi:hypothetical protein
VAGVEVFAQALEGGADAVATTGEDGTYSIPGLAPGRYKVQFEPVGSNELGQWYDGASLAADAEPVTLAAEANRGGVDAALASGSTVSGTVTEVGSGEPLAGIEVDAYTSACDGSGGTATTDSDGHYLIEGIAVGAYQLVFNPGGGGYEAALYSGQLSLAANAHREGVDGSLSATPAGSDAFVPTCVVPQLPVNLSAPAISGPAVVGELLTETHGGWSNSPTSYTYSWERCGASGSSCAPISGAGSQTYMPGAADVGSTIRVEETARNAEGPGAPAASEPTTLVQAAATGPTTPPAGGGAPEVPTVTTTEPPAAAPAAAPTPPAPVTATTPPRSAKKTCKKGKRLSHGHCVRKAKKKRHHKRPAHR